MNQWHSSPFTGLFARIGAMAPRPHDAACAICNGLAAPWVGGDAIAGSGIGWDEQSAEGACIGEAIERLQASPLPDDVLVRASFSGWERAESAIDPASWVLFHPEQYRQQSFPFEPLTRETICDWVCFRHARSGTPCWIPSELAFLNLPTPHRFAPGYSTGLAAGRNGDALVLRGLQEVIERDAVVGAWWGRYAIEECSLTIVLECIGREKSEKILRPNLTYRCFRIVTPFSDNVTMVTLEGEDREGYCFSIGSACRETRAATWEKSLLEAIHGRHFVRYLKAQLSQGVMTLGHSPRTFAEHAVFYSMRPQLLRGTAIFRAKPAEERSDLAVSEGLVELTQRLGPDRPVLFRSITPPALASEQLGWHVVRVVVPGLQPLHGHHDFPHLGGPLWLPRGLGDWTAMLPHPFP